MIKPVPVSQLRVGMFVGRVDGHWLEHSLWRTTFRIADARQLSTVTASGAQLCWIDTARGLDVDAPVSPPAAASVGPTAPVPRAVATRPPVSMDDEVTRAAQISKAALAVVETLFDDLHAGRSPDLAAGMEAVDQIVASVFRHGAALTSLVRLKEKDAYLHMHSVAVCALMVALGRGLGMDPADCHRAGLAGLLHDVGKAVMPPALLAKPGKLTDSEFAVMRTHAARGHALLLEAGIDDPDVLDACLHHHEKVSGAGYPHGLAGGALSTYARMAAVCDVYDAVTSHRPYKEPWDPATALTQMVSWDGQFDRTILAAFIKTIGVYPVGSLVRLTSGKLAVVAENRPSHPRAPIVRVFYSAKHDEPVPVHLVDLQHPDNREQIVGIEPREPWCFPQLDRLWTAPALC